MLAWLSISPVVVVWNVLAKETVGVQQVKTDLKVFIVAKNFYKLTQRRGTTPSDCCFRAVQPTTLIAD